MRACPGPDPGAKTPPSTTSLPNKPPHSPNIPPLLGERAGVRAKSPPPLILSLSRNPLSLLTPKTDILNTLTHLHPKHFEQTVLDLLEAIGYGQAQHLGRTGDGGIDGIINQDPLGLDRIYVQAKRWTKPVGEPEVRTFSGSLDPHGATRGVLITTSKFTRTARRTAQTISTGNKHIRLVDGQELTQLMMSLKMGIETTPPHRTRKQDKDHPAQHT